MRKGFTLIELLVVIAILAVLAVAVVLVLNPAELLRQSRDSRRLSDLAAINNAIALYLADGQTGWSQACIFTYASSSPAGWPIPGGTCATSTDTVSTSTSITGTGWVNINFSNISTGSPLPRLPLDPVNGLCTSNGTANEVCQYAFMASSTLGAYKLDVDLESVKYASVAANDGGIDNTGSTALYELGSNLTLNP